MRCLSGTRRRVVTCAAALAVTVLASSCSGSSAGTHVTAYFTRAVSLYPHGQVLVLGLPAGRVSSVATEGDRVRVELVMNAGVPLPADVQATIIPQSLIGERSVELFPAWTTGQAKAPNGLVLGVDKTSIPVEPDEALAALKHLLDSLDPHATGRLVKNLADDLKSNGANLNGAIKGLAQLSDSFAAKDQELGDLITHFDRFAATLDTREQQLGTILDRFATMTALLSQERKDIESLVGGLAQVSGAGLALVSEHGPRLAHDIEVLTATLQSVRANIDGVRQLLASTPVLVAGDDLNGKDEGLLAAWDPKYHHLDLRTSASPTVSAVLGLLGLGSFCVPGDTVCPGGGLPVPPIGPVVLPLSTGAAANPAPGALRAPAVPSATGASPATASTKPAAVAGPIDGMIDLLGSPTAVAVRPVAMSVAVRVAKSPRRGGVAWIRRTARALVEAVT